MSINAIQFNAACHCPSFKPCMAETAVQTRSCRCPMAPWLAVLRLQALFHTRNGTGRLL